MSKNIVFCADGTWNGPGRDDESDKGAAPSNVFKIFANLDGKDSVADLRRENEQERALAAAGGEVQQVAKYLHGVGDSDNYLVRLLGGTLGAGLITRILRGYTFVSRNYVRGDKIFLVGFSRGAYTARSLAGLICAKGLLDASQQDLSDKEEAYRRAAAIWYEYRRSAVRNNQSWLDMLEETVVDLPGFFSRPATAPRITDVPIEAVAVWDTVGSLGVPEYAKAEDARIDALQFCDKTLNGKVNKGLHAVSLDERRIDFTPTLWDPDAARITQVLFPGAHADVGGGYPSNESGLSDCALRWMMGELDLLGVNFSGTPFYSPNPDAKASAHEPWSHPPFDLGRQITRQFVSGFPIHRCLDDRRRAGPVSSDVGNIPAFYDPPNIPPNAPVIPWR